MQYHEVSRNQCSSNMFLENIYYVLHDKLLSYALGKLLTNFHVSIHIILYIPQKYILKCSFLKVIETIVLRLQNTIEFKTMIQNVLVMFFADLHRKSG